VARKSVSYLYDYLLAHENEGNFFAAAPRKAARFYTVFANEGKAVYSRYQAT
jgi:hypothetical protein